MSELPGRFVKHPAAPDAVGCALVVVILAVVVAIAFALDAGKSLDDLEDAVDRPTHSTGVGAEQ